jgi:hypothetical protein
VAGGVADGESGALDCVGAAFAGPFEPASPDWLAARAGQEIAAAMLAAIKRVERILFSWVLLPNLVSNVSAATIVPN